MKKVAVIGLGVVGSATAKNLKKFSNIISKRTGIKIKLALICDIRPNFKNFAKRLGVPFTTDIKEVLNNPDIDIVVELIGGYEPAGTIIKTALRNGKDVVTANKALLAASGKELFALADSLGRIVGYEAAVCGAIPLIKNISQSLVGCEVDSVYGVLNGTTNYILDRMYKDRIDFSEALKQAQVNGYAEKDSSLDIDGKDTLHKLCILSYLCFNVWPKYAQVFTEGISKISLLDVLYADELGCKIKLLAIGKCSGNTVDLRVHPAFVPADKPIGQVDGAYNAVSFKTYPAGNLFFYGEGAGGTPTSASVISDIVSIASGQKNVSRKLESVKFKNINDTAARYYIRFTALDKPGVLSAVAKILSEHKISISSVSQKEQCQKKYVPIIMITHKANERALRAAIMKIDKLEFIKQPTQLIRIVNC